MGDRKVQDPFGVLIVIAAIFVVPALAARFAIGGDWRQVAASYGLWFLLLLLFLGVPGSGRWSEKLGWMTIMAIFLTIVAVPILTLIQRFGGWFMARGGE